MKIKKIEELEISQTNKNLLKTLIKKPLTTAEIAADLKVSYCYTSQLLMVLLVRNLVKKDKHKQGRIVRYYLNEEEIDIKEEIDFITGFPLTFKEQKTD